MVAMGAALESGVAYTSAPCFATAGTSGEQACASSFWPEVEGELDEVVAQPAAIARTSPRTNLIATSWNGRWKICQLPYGSMRKVFPAIRARRPLDDPLGW